MRKYKNETREIQVNAVTEIVCDICGQVTYSPDMAVEDSQRIYPVAVTLPEPRGGARSIEVEICQDCILNAFEELKSSEFLQDVLSRFDEAKQVCMAGTAHLQPTEVEK